MMYEWPDADFCKHPRNKHPAKFKNFSVFVKRKGALGSIIDRSIRPIRKGAGNYG
jgi:hypothetical protein